MIIKKATRLPETVEYFVWDGNFDGLPDWMDGYSRGYFIDDHGDYELEIGSVVVRRPTGVDCYQPEDFAAKFLPVNNKR